MHKIQKYNKWYKKEYRSMVDKNVRRHVLKHLYGITPDQYKAMLKFQNNRCAICRKFETTRNKRGTLYRLGVDHNHQTGKVRGLLCMSCNTKLVVFENKNFVKL